MGVMEGAYSQIGEAFDAASQEIARAMKAKDDRIGALAGEARYLHGRITDLEAENQSLHDQVTELKRRLQDAGVDR